MNKIVGVFLLFWLVGCGNEESSITNNKPSVKFEKPSIKDKGGSLSADKMRDTYCYYSGYPMPDDMTRNNKDMCQKYWEKKGYIGGSTQISHSYTQEDLTGKKGEKLIGELIERDKQIMKDLEERFAQQQKIEAITTPCKDVMYDFMRERKYLSKPELINEINHGSVYYCTVRYLKDNVNYSLPVHVQITYNPSTGTYKYKSL